MNGTGRLKPTSWPDVLLLEGEQKQNSTPDVANPSKNPGEFWFDTAAAFQGKVA